MKMIKEMLTVVFVLIGFSAIMYMICEKAERAGAMEYVYVADPNYVQNIFEIQQRLKDQGLYAGEIDGIWGPQTDEAYCNWCAINEFRRSQ